MAALFVLYHVTCERFQTFMLHCTHILAILTPYWSVSVRQLDGIAASVL